MLIVRALPDARLPSVPPPFPAPAAPLGLVRHFLRLGPT